MYNKTQSLLVVMIKVYSNKKSQSIIHIIEMSSNFISYRSIYNICMLNVTHEKYERNQKNNVWQMEPQGIFIYLLNGGCMAVSLFLLG